MPLNLPDPQLPGNPQDALQSIQRNFEALAQTLAPPVPTGTVLPYAASTAPEGYLICNGGEVAVADYPRLDALLGTTYGARTNGSGGAGTSHFRLPDLRGRVIVSRGTHSTVDDLGESDATAVNNRRPAHSHTGTAESAGSHSHTLSMRDKSASVGSSPEASAGNTLGNPPSTSSSGAHTHSVTVGSTGGTTDAPSFIVLNHIIKA